MLNYWLPKAEASDDLHSFVLNKEPVLTLNFCYVPLIPLYYNSQANKKFWIKNLYRRLDYLKNDLVKFHGVVKNEFFFGDLDFVCNKFESSNFFNENDLLLVRNLLMTHAKEINFDYFIILSNKKINLNHINFLKIKNVMELSYDEFNNN